MNTYIMWFIEDESNYSRKYQKCILYIYISNKEYILENLLYK